jgi:SSS family solute:Na+ symporter
MNLTWLDGLTIGLYLFFNLGIGFYYRRQANRGIEEFFISGRSSPWWLAGTSMAATTFASDTPLAITGMVATGGIAGNWLWWSFVFSGMLTVFVYSRLWRRANVVTDVEFSEIRYSGRPAAFLRGFRALYLAIPINCIVMGWVSLAMVKVLMLILDVDKITAILAVLFLTAITCAISGLAGLRGVLITDLTQFALMGSLSIALANFAVVGVGGLGALTESVIEVRGEAILAFFPDFDSPWMPMLTFFVYMAVNWWATWYPGAEPGGGGFIAQRMFSTRDERHSLLATLWFNIVHYALRPWPWIIVSLVSLVAYPDLADPESGYVLVMINYLPTSARGLMIAGFAAAFMSTISTLLNWGASYLSSDIYQRFINPAASERELVTTSRIATVLLAGIAAVVTFYMESIGGAWKLLLATGAGTGGVLILRWFWWRINAWSEVAAMATAFVVSIALQWQMGYDTDDPNDFAIVMLWTVSVTTIVWVTVTLLTGPEPYDKLLQFYKRVRPYPLLWGPIPAAAGDKDLRRSPMRDVAYWFTGCGLIYGALFGIGKLLFGELAISVAWFILCAICSWIIYSGLRSTRFSSR